MNKININECWKPVVGYEGLYEVSDLGRVRSLNYKRSRKESIMKQVLDGDGYYCLLLYKNGKRKRFSVHRLVVTAFIGPIPKGFVVNHINECQTDNRLENLEICTIRENSIHGTANARRSASLKGRKFSEEHKAKISKAKLGRKKS